MSDNIKKNFGFPCYFAIKPTQGCTDVTFREYFEGSQICKQKCGKQNSLRNVEETFIGLCNQLYPMLDIELLKKACPQFISAKSDCLFKGSKTYRLFFFLQAVGKLTANYSEVPGIEPLEQSTVNLLYLACSTRILHRKLFTSLSC